MNKPVFEKGQVIEYHSASGRNENRRTWLIEKVSMLTERYFLVSTEGVKVRHMVSFLRQYKYKITGSPDAVKRKVPKKPKSNYFLGEKHKSAAIKFDRKNAEEVMGFTGNDRSKTHFAHALTLKVRTGTIVVRPGQWVVSLPDKHFIVLTNRVFNKLYKSA